MPFTSPNGSNGSGGSGLTAEQSAVLNVLSIDPTAKQLNSALTFGVRLNSVMFGELFKKSSAASMMATTRFTDDSSSFPTLTTIKDHSLLENRNETGITPPQALTLGDYLEMENNGALAAGYIGYKTTETLTFDFTLLGVEVFVKDAIAPTDVLVYKLFVGPDELGLKMYQQEITGRTIAADGKLDWWFDHPIIGVIADLPVAHVVMEKNGELLEVRLGTTDPAARYIKTRVRPISVKDLALIEDLAALTLTVIDDQLTPVNLADVVTDGTYCIRNIPADVAAVGLAAHVAGDVLRKAGATWKKVISPVAGTTHVWLSDSGKSGVFVDSPVVGDFPFFIPTVTAGEPFSVPYIGSDLPGQVSFDGTLLIGNTVGGLTTADFGNSALLIVSGITAVWVRDSANPERSGMYNLIVNDTGTGDYTLRRDYNFRRSESFADGQAFFVGAGTGGDEANKSYVIALTPPFDINTSALLINEAKLTVDNITEGSIPRKVTGVLVDSALSETADKVTVSKSVTFSGNGFETAANYIIHSPAIAGAGLGKPIGNVHVLDKQGDIGVITALQFTAGSGGTGPTLSVDNMPFFAPGDFALIENTKFNNGLWEIGAASVLDIEMKGIGGTAKVEDFTKDQFTTAVETGTITNVIVSVTRTAQPGIIAHAEGFKSPLEYFPLAHAKDVPITVVERFAHTNARFLGTLGLPASQGGWVDSSPGGASIDVVTGEVVFGVTKNVILHNDNSSSGSTSSTFNLDAANWVNINTHGIPFGGIARLGSVNGSNGFFAGIQADSAENPLGTGNRRYGLLFDNNGGNLRVKEADNTANAVTFDGTGGNPLVPFDQYFLWLCLIPAGLGPAAFWLKGVLTTFVPAFITNDGGLGTKATLSSGSSAGTGRVTFHDNFGFTVYEEAATKTFSSTSMLADIAKMFTPEGIRDYTIIVPDNNPMKIGAKLSLVLRNVGGKVTLTTQNTALPKVLFNGMPTLEIDVTKIMTIELVNTVDNANIYVTTTSKEISEGAHDPDKLYAKDDEVVVEGKTYRANDLIDGVTGSVAFVTGLDTQQWTPLNSPDPLMTTFPDTDGLFVPKVGMKYVEIEYVSVGGSREAVANATIPVGGIGASGAAGGGSYGKLRLTKAAFDREFPAGMTIVAGVAAVPNAVTTGGYATAALSLFLKDGGANNRVIAPAGLNGIRGGHDADKSGAVQGAASVGIPVFNWTSTDGVTVIQVLEGTTGGPTWWLRAGAASTAGILLVGEGGHSPLGFGGKPLGQNALVDTGVFSTSAVAGKGFGWGVGGALRTGDNVLQAGDVGGPSICIVTEHF